ncbi:MAG: DUF975 family protein [Acholeplasmataceae bacterium]
MRVIYAFKTLIKNYRKIMPIFLVVAITTTLLSNIIPLIGMVLLLPLKISVSFVMIVAIRRPNQLTFMPLYIGFRRKNYLKNVYYMTLKEVLFLLPAVIGAIISGLIYRFVEIDTKMTIIIINLIIFSIPAAIISLMLAMVPFLLADSTFDQRKHNPLKHSAIILKGSYIKLISMRLFFVPWLLWFASGFLVTAVSFYNLSIQNVSALNPLSISWILTLPIKLLLIDPWYQMTHAQLYVSLRQKAKNQKRV